MSAVVVTEPLIGLLVLHQLLQPDSSTNLPEVNLYTLEINLY